MQTIQVTRPYLPPMERYLKTLTSVWDTHMLSNCGVLHERLEESLRSFLKVKNVSLVSNGTVGLQLALMALSLKGKVITTPYSFVATANAIVLSGLEPVFVDLEDDSYNLDPELIEMAVDGKTSAILPVHVYGFPCSVARIEELAKQMHLKTVYDAAHAFGVFQDSESAMNWGDCSMVSFHATKVFHTFEGGALTTQDDSLARKINQLRNFGFAPNGDVTDCGTNGKMNEAQAAMGLICLEYLDKTRKLRKKWHDRYLDRLRDVPGLILPRLPQGLEYNYAYFPIQISGEYALTRDALFETLRSNGIYARKYFHPLITDFSFYRHNKIISKHKVSNASRMANRIICLPLYPELDSENVDRVCDIVCHV